MGHALSVGRRSNPAPGAVALLSGQGRAFNEDACVCKWERNKVDRQLSAKLLLLAVWYLAVNRQDITTLRKFLARDELRMVLAQDVWTISVNYCIRNGRSRLFAFLIEHCLHMYDNRFSKESLLDQVVRHGNIKVAQILLHIGAVTPPQTDYLMLRAGIMRQWGIVDVVLPILPLEFDNGWSKAFEGAANAQRLDMLRKLWNKPPSDERTVHSKWETSLTHAMSEGHENVVKLLIEFAKEARAICQDDAARESWVCKDAEVALNRPHPKIVSAMISSGLLDTPVTEWATAAMGRWTLSYLNPEVWPDCISLLHILLDAGADVTAEEGRKALYAATSSVNFEAIDILLGAGATYGDDLNRFHSAIVQVNNMSLDGVAEGHRGKNSDMVKMLVQLGPDGWKRNRGKMSDLLIHAVRVGKMDLVKLWLEFGADPGAKNGSPLRAALTSRNLEMAEQLWFRGSPAGWEEIASMEFLALLNKSPSKNRLQATVESAPTDAKAAEVSALNDVCPVPEPPNLFGSGPAPSVGLGGDLPDYSAEVMEKRRRELLQKGIKEASWDRLIDMLVWAAKQSFWELLPIMEECRELPHKGETTPWIGNLLITTMALTPAEFGPRASSKGDFFSNPSTPLRCKGYEFRAALALPPPPAEQPENAGCDDAALLPIAVAPKRKDLKSDGKPLRTVAFSTSMTLIDGETGSTTVITEVDRGSNDGGDGASKEEHHGATWGCFLTQFDAINRLVQWYHEQLQEAVVPALVKGFRSGNISLLIHLLDKQVFKNANSLNGALVALIALRGYPGIGWYLRDSAFVKIARKMGERVVAVDKGALLCEAARTGDPGVLEVLVSLGCTVASSEGEDALREAINAKNLEVADWLFERGAKGSLASVIHMVTHRESFWQTWNANMRSKIAASGGAATGADATGLDAGRRPVMLRRPRSGNYLLRLIEMSTDNWTSDVLKSLDAVALQDETREDEIKANGIAPVETAANETGAETAMNGSGADGTEVAKTVGGNGTDKIRSIVTMVTTCHPRLAPFATLGVPDGWNESLEHSIEAVVRLAQQVEPDVVDKIAAFGSAGLKFAVEEAISYASNDERRLLTLTDGVRDVIWEEFRIIAGVIWSKPDDSVPENRILNPENVHPSFDRRTLDNLLGSLSVIAYFDLDRASCAALRRLRKYLDDVKTLNDDGGWTELLSLEQVWKVFCAEQLKKETLAGAILRLNIQAREITRMTLAELVLVDPVLKAARENAIRDIADGLACITCSSDDTGSVDAGYRTMKRVISRLGREGEPLSDPALARRLLVAILCASRPNIPCNALRQLRVYGRCWTTPEPWCKRNLLINAAEAENASVLPFLKEFGCFPRDDSTDIPYREAMDKLLVLQASQQQESGALEGSCTLPEDPGAPDAIEKILSEASAEALAFSEDLIRRCLREVQPLSTPNSSRHETRSGILEDSKPKKTAVAAVEKPSPTIYYHKMLDLVQKRDGGSSGKIIASVAGICLRCTEAVKSATEAFRMARDLGNMDVALMLIKAGLSLGMVELAEFWRMYKDAKNEVDVAKLATASTPTTPSPGKKRAAKKRVGLSPASGRSVPGFKAGASPKTTFAFGNADAVYSSSETPSSTFTFSTNSSFTFGSSS
ncbi:hypothetical protein HK104_010037 [Borealophlyctis nickersoniae]|nr:hypothetical protein HK104_010037 [Borealophlyctis nickersoniae]